MIAVLAVLGAMAFVGAVAIYGGFVLYILWGWFVVPLGVPPIGIAWAIGISAVSALLVPTPPSPTEDQRTEHLAGVLAKPLIALAIGWVAKSAM